MRILIPYSVIFPFLLTACTSKEIIEKPIKIYVSLPCSIEYPPTPQRSGQLLVDIKSILIYGEALKRALTFCKGDKHDSASN